MHEYPQATEIRESKRVSSIKPWPHDAITGIIHGWGKIIVGTKGFRAQYAKPIALVARKSKIQRTIEETAEQYGLEIVDIWEVRKRGNQNSSWLKQEVS